MAQAPRKPTQPVTPAPMPVTPIVALPPYPRIMDIWIERTPTGADFILASDRAAVWFAKAAGHDVRLFARARGIPVDFTNAELAEVMSHIPLGFHIGAPIFVEGV